MFLRNFTIGGRLAIGFGLIVVLAGLAIALGFFGSRHATDNIRRTIEETAPFAFVTMDAEVNLLQMLADLRGYLALGDKAYHDGYLEAAKTFEDNLAVLRRSLHEQPDQAGVAVTARLADIDRALQAWRPLPERLFAIREDQLKREPALALLITQGTRPFALTITSLKKLIDSQARRRDAGPETARVIAEMAEAEAAYLAMIAGLRGYITTGRSDFKFEYDANSENYKRAIERVKKRSDMLDDGQRKLLQTIQNSDETFWPLPERMFRLIEGDQARMDLYMFRTEAVPLAETMLTALQALSTETGASLKADLTSGDTALVSAQRRMLVLALIVTAVAGLLSWIFRENVVGPVRRLTLVADEIGKGNLGARARVESGDEIGALATTFNAMSNQLETTLADLERRQLELQESATRFRRQSEYLGALNDTSLALISRFDLESLLSDLVKRAGELLGTPHGYIYLRDEEGDELVRKVGVGLYATSIGNRLKRGGGVAGRVWETGQPLMVEDYQAWDGRVVGADYGETIRAVMGLPLQSGSETIGVLGLAYDVGTEARFGEAEVELLTRFARLASISLVNARLYTETREAHARIAGQNSMLESLSNKLSKYLSPQVYSSIFTGKQDVRITSQRKKLSIFFSDIVGFTETTSHLESEELTSLLNTYLTEMAGIAIEYGATVDKFIGDAIMAFFGDPDTQGVKEDALACVKMAIAMQERMKDLQRQWSDLGSEEPFKLRIGINTGYCTVGNFGSGDRMDYTIIGGEVNLAARLQAHADVGGILIAHETYALVKDEILTIKKEPIQAKGFPRPIQTYQVAGLAGDAVPDGVIRHESSMFAIRADVAGMSREDRQRAIQTAEDVIAKLKAARLD